MKFNKMSQEKFENKVSKLKKHELLHLWQSGITTVDGFKRTLNVNQGECGCWECRMLAVSVGLINDR